MNREELQIKYSLVKSVEWQEIRKRLLDHIVVIGGTSINPEYLQGMLYLIKTVDLWEQEFLQEKNK